MHDHGQVVESGGVADHFLAGGRFEAGEEFAVEPNETFRAGPLGGGLETGESPEGVGEFQTFQEAAVGEARDDQAGAGRVAASLEEIGGVVDFGEEPFEVGEVLREFALADGGEDGDGGVFEVSGPPPASSAPSGR